MRGLVLFLFVCLLVTGVLACNNCNTCEKDCEKQCAPRGGIRLYECSMFGLPPPRVKCICQHALENVTAPSADEPITVQSCRIENCNCRRFGDCSTCTGRNCFCSCSTGTEISTPNDDPILTHQDVLDDPTAPYDDEPIADQTCRIENCNCRRFGDCSTCTGRNCFCSCSTGTEISTLEDIPVNHPTLIQETTTSHFIHTSDSTSLCRAYKGSAKLPPGRAQRLFAGAVYPGSSSVSVKIYVNNPTRDDVFLVHACTWPCIRTVDGCLIESNSCSFPYGYECLFRQPKQMVTSLFNVSTCAPYNAASGYVICRETPGFFNRHCELDYTMLFCEEEAIPDPVKECDI